METLSSQSKTESTKLGANEVVSSLASKNVANGKVPTLEEPAPSGTVPIKSVERDFKKMVVHAECSARIGSILKCGSAEDASILDLACYIDSFPKSNGTRRVVRHFVSQCLADEGPATDRPRQRVKMMPKR